MLWNSILKYGRLSISRRWLSRLRSSRFLYRVASSVESKFSEENSNSLYVTEVNQTLNIQAASYFESLVFPYKTVGYINTEENLNIWRISCGIHTFSCKWILPASKYCHVTYVTCNVFCKEWIHRLLHKTCRHVKSRHSWYPSYNSMILMTETTFGVKACCSVFSIYL